jgi:ATP-dependent Lhr-like helicase
MPLSSFHPLVARWFEGRFGTPTEPQRVGWPAIRAGEDTLVAAPTGSGKTLAAFLSCLDELVRDGFAGRLEDRVRAVYVSPLKALSNDIQKNLEEPLAQLRAAAAAGGEDGGLPEIRVAVRTGDTPSGERQAMLRRPPHLLVTTPESLYLLLTSARGRSLLGGVQTVIVDEIHAVARDKRGAHLALSLERLDALVAAGGGRRPVRVGLSATQRPIEEIARFLVGTRRVEGDHPRCAIVDVGHRREMDLAIEVPKDELAAVASAEQWGETYDRLVELVRSHRATLVFVNTRRQVERVSHALGQRLGEEAVAAHHGSLSRAVRLRAEERLKRGEIPVVVATASLELGIDIGEVDLVCQLESPRSIAVALQRFGRSGHWRGAIPKARLFPATRDQLVECAALLRAIRNGELERTAIPPCPIDILAQQIVAEAASEDIGEDALFERVRGAWPYRNLARAEFDQLIAMLSEGIAVRQGRKGAHLHRDGVHRRLKGRRGARLAALTGGGAIPDTAQYAVVAEPEGLTVGSVDEDFAVETLSGDVILLGNTSWRVRRVETTRLRVEDAHGAAPNVPFWLGEAPGRTTELSQAVASLRLAVEERLGDPAAAARWAAEACSLPAAGAEQMIRYLAAGRAALGALPTQDTLIAERFFDEAGGMQLVIHAPLGARINRAFGLGLRKRFCRTFDFELQAAATDDGVLLSLGPQHSFPLESIFDFLSASSIEEVLVQAALQAPMFGVRWRWNATRALAIPRMMNGKKVPPNLTRMRAEDLLAAVFPAQVACQDNAPGGAIEVPDHPLVRETVRDCLHEAMDIEGLKALLRRMSQGKVRLMARDTTEPSPLCHEILGARPYAYLDDAPLEERRARAVSLRRTLPGSADELGALDAEAIATVAEQAWPDVRNADELHDALLDLGLLPDGEAGRWRPMLEALAASGRAALATTRPGGQGDDRPAGREASPARHWVAAERLSQLRALEPMLGAATLAPAIEPPPLPGGVTAPAPPDPQAAMAAIVRGWMGCIGPVTAAGLARRLALPSAKIDAALLQLETEGVVLRGRFAAQDGDDLQWCERTLLARIHRLTLGRLRKEIEPVTSADFLRFLLRWQHVHPGTQLAGSRGVAEVVAQLQGFHLPAAAWERDVLPARVQGYQPEWLDQLCLSGEIAWGRLSVDADPDEPPRRRARPTRSAPLTLALREDLPWLLEATAGPLPALGQSAQVLVELLARRGASFLADLAAASRRLPAEIEQALWELVSAGLVTSDGFGGLRTLIAAPAHEARPWRGGYSPPRTRPSGGRWALLREAVRAGSIAEGDAKGPAEGWGHPPSQGSAAGAGRHAPLQMERLASQYLTRYGVVFRDLLSRETHCPPWRELLTVYRRMEDRGDVRGGRFVSGYTGEQFALAEAVEALRTVRRIARTGAERVEKSAADPLNLVGIIGGGSRVAATLRQRVRYQDGVAETHDPAPVALSM